VYLGLVNESHLLRRRRQGKGGCLVALDVNGQSPPRADPGLKKKVIPNKDQGCKRISRNGRYARDAVRLLVTDQKMERQRALPPRIRCGQIRSAVRSVFPSELTPVHELSVKSVQKLELDPCEDCLVGAANAIEEWKESRFSPKDPVDVAHVERFKKALRCIVTKGWNRGVSPYIPTGHATMSHTRVEGGSWNDEDFSPYCVPGLVYSSGKPRVVTMYSSYNAEVLTPLHDRLYSSLQRGGWLLVGSPTDEKVKRLNGNGPYVSVDYQQATDNVRVEYCREAIEVLIEKSEGLSPDEIRCLRVVGDLKILCELRKVTNGQPMGSLISFPLLCLINRVCVDLSLADLLEQGKISMKQFTEHRCLINGDDLLYREFDDSLGIRDGILRHGHAIGLILNREKSLVSPVWAELNSTAFYNGERRKKTNVAVLNLGKKVTDVIGFLADSVIKQSTFGSLLLRWRKRLKEQVVKLQGGIPSRFYKSLALVSHELRTVPRYGQTDTNPFPVVIKPADYGFSREEEVCYISERVARLKGSGFIPRKTVRWSTGPEGSQTFRKAISLKVPLDEDKCLRLLADKWYEVQKEKLSLEEGDHPVLTIPAWDERSRVAVLTDYIRGLKETSRLGRADPDAGRFQERDAVRHAEWGGFVSLITL
jgi:hypothetical protein